MSRRRVSYRDAAPSKRKSDELWWWLGGAAAVAALVATWKTNNPISEAVRSALRTPQSILDAVATIDPEHAPELQPGYGGAGNTWCNHFIAEVTAMLGASVPYAPTLVNDQILWIDAGNNGWYQVGSADEAQQAALSGKIALATYYNFAGHGHIALILPIDGPMQIAQAGSANFNQGPLAQGFGFIQPVFYVHD